jgi:hypothetical protein
VIAALPEPGGEREAKRFSGVRKLGRAGVTLAALAGFVLLVVTKRHTLTSATVRTGHAHWLWIPIAIGFEAASMVSFAWMQRQVLRAGGTRVHSGSMLVTTVAANALSVSVPVAGPGLGTTFTFRRFKKLGTDATVASWALLVGGLVSWLGVVAVLLVGAAVSGKAVVIGVALVAGLLAIGAAGVFRGLLVRSLISLRLERAIAWLIAHVARLIAHPIHDSERALRSWLNGLRSLRLTRSEWSKVGCYGLANWLADAGVLAISLIALGAPVPWRALLLIYILATVVGSLGITPGGIGLVEGTLCLGLVSSGVPVALALPAVLLYRFVSFWLVAATGWILLLYLRLGEHAQAPSLPGLATS